MSFYKIILFFICILFTSCNAKKVTMNKKASIDKEVGIEDSTPIVDSDADGIDYRVYPVVSAITESHSILPVESLAPRTTIVNETGNQKVVENINKNLIDKTKGIESENFGIIAYNIPENLIINEYSTIRLRISRDNEVESILIGKRKIPIINEDSDDRIIIEDIEIDSIIEAKLYGDPEVFLISTINSPIQNILETGYTEWIWRVKPLKSGEHYLKLVIIISGRDIVVYEKDILVESNWKWSFSSWFARWWQPIMATIITPIIIPFLIWAWRRRKKEKGR